MVEALEMGLNQPYHHSLYPKIGFSKRARWHFIPRRSYRGFLFIEFRTNRRRKELSHRRIFFLVRFEAMPGTIRPKLSM